MNVNYEFFYKTIANIQFYLYKSYFEQRFIHLSKIILDL